MGKITSVCTFTCTLYIVYSVETLDDGQYICPKHVEFFIKMNLRNSASRWLLLYEYITMDVPMNIKSSVSLIWSRYSGTFSPQIYRNSRVIFVRM